MNNIPVLGAAIVNGPHWLHKLISSVDHPVDNFLIVNNNGKGELNEELDNLTKISHPFIKNIKVVHMPTNLGCAGAWNLIIKSYLNAPYWIITSHDVSFSPGFLEEMANKASNKDIGMVFGHEGDYGTGSYDLFLIKDWVVDKIGLFDENLYPAYCEDWDYMLRIINNPVNISYNISKPYYHGGKLTYNEGGKMSMRDANEDVRQKINDAWNLNKDYMYNKWGKGWNSFSPLSEPKIKKTFDLHFRRQKHLGF